MPRLPFIAVAAICLAAGCGDATSAPEPKPPVTTTFLEDVVVPNLPSPYYHFEYDADGVMRRASFASGLLVYDLAYERGRLTSQQNTVGGHEQLAYAYNDFGRVALVEYKHADGTVYVQVTLVYNGEQLARLERRRRLPNGDLELNKEMTFTYYADGNVREITTHTPEIAGLQSNMTYTDLYENYDHKVNVDAFSLLHAEFFDQLVLLPDVVLQKGNARRVTRTGDAENYVVDYTYTYDGSGRPLTQTGSLTFTSGQNSGQQFQTQASYTYY